MKLLEIISGDKLGRPNRGRMRVQKVENLNRVLDFLKRKKIKVRELLNQKNASSSLSRRRQIGHTEYSDRFVEKRGRVYNKCFIKNSQKLIHERALEKFPFPYQRAVHPCTYLYCLLQNGFLVTKKRLTLIRISLRGRNYILNNVLKFSWKILVRKIFWIGTNV